MATILYTEKDRQCRDANEVLTAAVIAAVVGLFGLTILYQVGLYEPVRAGQPQHSALGTCPNCHLIRAPDPGCGKLKHQAWIDCMDAAQDSREQK